MKHLGDITQINGADIEILWRKRMDIIPITLKIANDYVTEHHRHHGKVAGCKFAIGIEDNGELVGVAICGRPVARALDDGKTLEINRVCTNGIRNGCSMLYGACTRIAKNMGYKKVITYILDTELGSSVKASNFQFDGMGGGTHWNHPSRPRRTDVEITKKQRWVKYL